MVNWYLLKISGETRPELVEGRRFRQVQLPPPRFIERLRVAMQKYGIESRLTAKQGRKGLARNGKTRHGGI